MWLLLGAIIAADLLTGAESNAAWQTGGVRIAPGSPWQAAPKVAADGQGGMYCAFRGSDPQYHVRLQRLDADGNIPGGWPDGALSFGPPDGGIASGLSVDAAGYATVVWEAQRDSTIDIYAQRVGPDGQIARGWPVDGRRVCGASRRQWLSQIVGDGAYGNFISWIDDRENYGRVYVQHLLGGGSPASGWPQDGKPVCAVMSGHSFYSLASDGKGGVLCVWEDFRTGRPRVYAQHISGSGTLLWPDTGVAVCPGDWNQQNPLVGSDGRGGAYVAWGDVRTVGYGQYYCQHIDSTSRRLWESGRAVAAAGGPQGFGRLLADDTPGFRLVWFDARVDYWHDDTYAQSITDSGTVAPGWPALGLELAPGERGRDDLVARADGSGGVFAAWTDYRDVIGSPDVVAQHVLASGLVAPGWPDTGRMVTRAPYGQRTPSLTTDGRDGLLVAWEDAGALWIKAGRISADGVVPVQVSLIEAEATPTRVRIAWSVGQPAGTGVDIERREGEGEWSPLASGLVEGDGAVRYEDTSVVAGHRYGYRLVVNDAGASQPLGETWVDVPSASGIAIGAAWWERSSGRLRVRYTLARAGPAELEVFDVAGRRLARQVLAARAAGEQEAVIQAGATTRSGVGFVRLKQGADEASCKAIVAR